MGTRRLYTTSIPEAALQRQTGDTSQQQELAKLTGISAAGSVATVGSNPGEFRVQGQFRGEGAELLAREVSELASSSGITSVAFYDADTSVASAGYYSVEQIQNRRFRPQRPEVATFSVRLAREGTKDSHRRYLRTNRRQANIGGFGSSATGRLAIPDAATDVVWLSEDKSQTQSATPAETVAAEKGTVALYDPTTVSGFGSPGLTYNLEYADAGNVDAAVFDDYGRDEFDADGNFRWQQAFESSHEFEGAAVLENGVVRLSVDATANTLTAEEWDGSAWVTRTLGASGGWQVQGIDVVTADPSRVHAQFVFEDTDDGSRYRLDAFLHRGWSNIQFAIPETASGPIPADLVTYLDPVASDRYTDARGDAGILDREVLRA